MSSPKKIIQSRHSSFRLLQNLSKYEFAVGNEPVQVDVSYGVGQQELLALSRSLAASRCHRLRISRDFQLPGIGPSQFDFAVSNTSDPTAGWAFRHYDMNDLVEGVADLADFPRMGWNADAYVISFNMFLNAATYDHVAESSLTTWSSVSNRSANASRKL